jgi:hypothetical protein
MIPPRAVEASGTAVFLVQKKTKKKKLKIFSAILENSFGEENVLHKAICYATSLQSSSILISDVISNCLIQTSLRNHHSSITTTKEGKTLIPGQQFFKVNIEYRKNATSFVSIFGKGITNNRLDSHLVTRSEGFLRNQKFIKSFKNDCYKNHLLTLLTLPILLRKSKNITIPNINSHINYHKKHNRFVIDLLKGRLKSLKYLKGLNNPPENN